MRPPAAERADVPRPAAERGRDCRVVELGVVGQDDDVRARVDAGSVGELIGPANEQLVGVGKPLAGQECGPRVDDHGVEPDGVGQADQVHGDLAGPDDDKAGGGDHVDVEVAGTYPDRAGDASAQRVPGEVHEIGVGRRVAERARPDPPRVEEDTTGL